MDRLWFPASVIRFHAIVQAIVGMRADSGGAVGNPSLWMLGHKRSAIKRSLYLSCAVQCVCLLASNEVLCDRLTFSVYADDPLNAQ